jgi:hypothetical protein
MANILFKIKGQLEVLPVTLLRRVTQKEVNVKMIILTSTY